MFEFTPIGNGYTQAKLLCIDNTITILADPGWNGIDSLDFYNEYVQSIDMIILSQTTIEYLGAYVQLLHTYPRLRNIPIYSTLPVSKLGRIAICELYRSIGLLGPINGNLIELNHISKYFNSIKSFNYSQTINLSHINNKLINLSITAYNSGYSIGGSIWLIENNINERIVYAPIWNHAKDSFLNNCKMFHNSDLMRPTTFITNCEFTSSAKLSHQLRTEKFLKLIEENINSNTSVLLPTSLSGRFFELLFTILQHKKLNAINMYLINYTGLENLKISSNFLEWMNSNINKLFENELDSSKLLNNRIQSINFKDLNKLINNTYNIPKIFFIEELDMIDNSLFNKFLIDMNSKLNYSIILTERPNKSSKLYSFYKTWKQNVDSNENNLKEGQLILLEMPNMKFKSFDEDLLRGKDLSNYEKKITERRELEIKLEKEELERQKLQDLADKEVIDIDTDTDTESESESESEFGSGLNQDLKKNGSKENGNNINTELKQQESNKEDVKQSVEITTNIIKEAEIKYQLDESKFLKINEILNLPRDFDVQNMKHKNRMFPTVNFKFNNDDYGIVIKHEDFQVYDDDRFPIVSNDNEIIVDKVSGDLEDNNENRDYNQDGINNDNYDDDDDREFDEHGKRRKRNKRITNDNNNKRQRNNNVNTNSVDILKFLDPMIDPVNRTENSATINIRCGLTFIDLSGNHDLRSLKFSTKQLKPRKVILLPEFKGGNLDDLMIDLQNDTKRDLKLLQSNLEIEYIKSKLNEKINLGNVITSYEILIDDQLVSNINWQLLNDEYNVGYVSGVVEKIKDWEYKLKPLNLTDNSLISSSLKNSSISNIKIGDIKLTQLRNFLKLNDYRVELLGDGRLVIDDELVIVKNNEGNLTIEGGLGSLFYSIKKIIENMLATI
jgi:cleavage and polyadenylation specificity factor subunit 2